MNINKQLYRSDQPNAEHPQLYTFSAVSMLYQAFSLLLGSDHSASRLLLAIL